jgi:hypothetical protein
MLSYRNIETEPVLNILFTIKKLLIKNKNDPKVFEVLNELASLSVKIAVQHFYTNTNDK